MTLQEQVAKALFEDKAVKTRSDASWEHLRPDNKMLWLDHAQIAINCIFEKLLSEEVVEKSANIVRDIKLNPYLVRNPMADIIVGCRYEAKAALNAAIEAAKGEGNV
jgi:hypothetical protein